MTCVDYAHIQIMGYGRKNTHHHKLGYSQSESAERKRYKTFLHILKQKPKLKTKPLTNK